MVEAPHRVRDRVAGLTASAAARGPRSDLDFAAMPYPLSAQQAEAGRRGFTAGKAAVIDILKICVNVRRELGQAEAADALLHVIELAAERDLDLAELDPRR